MRILQMVVLVGVLLLALGAFMFTYTVRFTEAAVVTTFGRAGDDSIKTEAGLYFKAPYPIQSVIKYDTRVRVVETRKEAQQTADDRQVVAEAFCTYRVSDPRVFFSRFGRAGDRAVQHFEEADSLVQTKLRAALGELSGFRLDELFTIDGSGSRIPELEERVLESIRRSQNDGGSLSSDFGIEVVGVGITSIVFPETTTRAVFERMEAERNRLAQEIESEGESLAQEIESRAEANAQKIRAFAEQLAASIRARGEEEAAPYLADMRTNPELAAFLAQLDLLATQFRRKATLVLSTDLPGMGVFRPDLLNDVSAGEIPDTGLTGIAPADTRQTSASARSGGGAE
ncbi:MAG: SPFH domain-containing protein [Planctomycetota bacterium]